VALRAAVGLADCEPCMCDVNGTDGVTATDAQYILRSCVELEDPPTACPLPSTTTTTTVGSTTTTT
jgi:hypothetical protein